MGEHAFGQRKQGLARVGECDVAPGAVEKLRSEVRFKGCDLPAQRRLGKVQKRGGTREMAGAGDLHETLKLFQVHD